MGNRIIMTPAGGGVSNLPSQIRRKEVKRRKLLVLYKTFERGSEA